MLYSQIPAQGSVPPALGKDTVVSLKLNLPYPYIKKIKAYENSLNLVESYRTVVNFHRVIINV